jgi:hypothetical protein
VNVPLEDLKTWIWAKALVRRAEVGGAFATIARRGDSDAGAVLVKVSVTRGKARLYAPAQNGEGERIWLNLSNGPLGDEEVAVDAYVSKRAGTDPDLWMIEIEDRQGRTFLTEPVDE